MRSANLNIIIKSLEKSTSHVARDFSELENLQSNPVSAAKFADACVRKIKKLLIDDLAKIRPHYNIFFSDGESVIRSETAEYSFLINALDGFDNLVRSCPDFTTTMALQHLGSDGKKETISSAILKIVANETYYCEKGFGAFLNNRRIRVSKRTSGGFVVSAQDPSLVDDKKLSLRNYGCQTMEVAYLASSKTEKAFFAKDSNEFLTSTFLLVKEAGGKVVESEKAIVISC